MDVASLPHPLQHPWSAHLLECIAALLATLAAAWVVYGLGNSALPHVPVVNPKRWREWTYTRSRVEFLTSARRLVEEARRLYRTPFLVIADLGPITVLPPEMAEEIRNDPRLSFARLSHEAFHGYLHGFEPFKEEPEDFDMVKEVARHQLTRGIPAILGIVRRAGEEALHDTIGDSYTWHPVHVHNMAGEVVSRIAATVFVGPELGKNARWHALSVEYTQTAFAAANQLRLWPKPLRPVAHQFLPQSRKLRAIYKEAKGLLMPVLRQRRDARSKEGSAEHWDALTWLDDIAAGRHYDPLSAQLGLALSAIHTSTDFVSQLLLDLVQHPEYVALLRDEAAQCIAADGWTKTALQKMRLMDSFMKESQRLKPGSLMSMHRYAKSPLTLSDGTYIPRGMQLCVSMDRMWNAAYRERPEEFDGRRFLRMHEAGMDKPGNALLITASPEHLGFGYGKHACPGRFFAAALGKMLISQFLLGWEWKLPKGAPPPKIFEYGFTLNSDPSAQLEFRKKSSGFALSH